MKKLLYIFIGILLISCNGKKDAEETVSETNVDSLSMPKINSRLLIVPGKSIGNIALESNADQLESILGKADLSDAAMGKAWLTWFSKVSDSVTGNELNVYTEYKDNDMTEKVVRQIRVTSDEFVTADGIRTGKKLDDISRMTRSQLIYIGSYDTETPMPVGVFDIVAQGIAFEIENNVCTAIIIHTKGQRVSEEYISFHPDMKPM